MMNVFEGYAVVFEPDGCGGSAHIIAIFTLRDSALSFVAAAKVMGTEKLMVRPCGVRAAVAWGWSVKDDGPPCLDKS